MALIELVLHNIISFIVIISVIVFIHEFGHFWVARKFGVKIEAFSIGFGPKLFGWFDKKGTEWKVSAFPLGGYVKMYGDEGAASTADKDKIAAMSDEDRKIAFHTQPLHARFAIVAAGPLANFILAIFILTFFFIAYGQPETTSQVGEVVKDSAAAQVGLQKGDVITELDGHTITKFNEIKDIVTLNPGEEVTITYLRNGETIKSKIKPKLQETTDIFGNKVKLGLIGIAPGEVVHKKLGVVESIGAAFYETYSMCDKTIRVLGQMLTGRRSADQLSGVLRIADYSGQSVSKGFQMVFWFMAVLSINLGLVNLFPVPMLDGGHLAFYILEALRGKPLPDAAQEMLFRGGFVLLMMLMLFATYNDLKHFGIF